VILRAFWVALGLAAAVAAHAQPYRWVDKDGVVRYTDTPPPASAKDVRKLDAAAPKAAEPQQSFQLGRLQKDFPVTLYTAPNCKEGCDQAREALNKRGIPFREVQVWDKATNEELQAASGKREVPTLLVGRTAQVGFQAEAFDSLLDSAGYPRAGILPPLSQKAPPPPQGYLEATAKPEAKPVAQPEPAPRGRYDTSGLKGPQPQQGRYKLPGDTQ